MVAGIGKDLINTERKEKEDGKSLRNRKKLKHFCLVCNDFVTKESISSLCIIKGETIREAYRARIAAGKSLTT